MRTFKAILLLYTFCVPLASCQSRRVVDEFKQAQNQLLETSIKSDSAGMVLARQRFEKLLENQQVTENDSLAAWAHYSLLPIGNWGLRCLGIRPIL